MPPQRSNRNFIIAAVIISIIALIYGILNFDKAFPEIAINFSLSRKAALSTARDYMIGRNFNLDGYRQTIVFSFDEQAKLFMERELGVSKMTDLTKDSIDLWRWEARFFKPLEKLEYEVYVDPRGRITGFRRQLMESKPGLSLDSEAARIIAEAFVVGPMGEDIEQWTLIESNAFDRQARRDHVLTYELKGFEAEDATYRLEVNVQGAQIGGFKRYLNVPQAWQRDFSRLRSQNMVFHNIALFLYIVVSIVLFAIFIRNVRSGQIAWRTAIIISLVMAAATAIMIINSLPLALSRYITTESYTAFIGKQLLYSLLGGLGIGAFVLILMGAGERGYRRDNPDKLYIPNIFTRRGYKSREFFQATLMGYVLAAFHVGFVVFFYVIGGRIGFWSPAEMEYDNSVSTLLPWIFPLAASMMASLTEEFWFRLFGISFFKKLFKSTVIAVILQAFLWGFLHSNYPQQPGFVRGLEVGLIGIAAGVVMLRFGIWATLTWHFVVDAVFIGLFLFRSDNPYFWVSGLIVCGGLSIPAIMAGLVYLRKRRFEPVDDLLNSAVEDKFAEREAMVEQAAEGDLDVDGEKSSYQPLSIKIRRAVLLIGLSGIIIALLLGAARFGDDFAPQIDRGEAIRIARDALTERYGLSVDSFNVGVECSQRYSARWDATGSYVKKYSDPEIAGKVFFTPGSQEIPQWYVSFKRDLDPEYYYASIDMLVGTVAINHILPDSAHGVDLIVDVARLEAEVVFNELETHPEDYQLIEETSKKHSNRRDHTFTWETIEPVTGDAHHRRTVLVQGDEVQYRNRLLKVPEEWLRHEEEKGLRWTIISILRVALLLGGAVLDLVSLRKRLKTRRIRYRMGVVMGVVVLVLGILNQWNDWGRFWLDYVTSVPAASYTTMSLLSTAVQVLLSALFAAVVVIVANSLAEGYHEAQSWTWGSNRRRSKFEDGIILTVGTLGAGFGIIWLFHSFERWLSLPVHNYVFSLPTALDMYIPWFGILFDSLMTGLIFGSLVMIMYVIIEIGTRSRWVKAFILLLAAIAAAEFIAPVNGNPTMGEFIWSIARSLVVVVVGYLMMWFWIQGRLWVLIVSYVIGSLIYAGTTFLDWGDTPYYSQGWLLLLLAAVPVFWMLWGVRKTKLRE